MAKRTGIYITDGGTLDAIIDSLREFRELGPEIAGKALDLALDATAELSRSLAHVSHDKHHSGALRASERHSSETYPGAWTGQINYGEPDTVPQRDHVTGAFWELQRGGEHAAFVDSLAEATAPAWEEALNAWWDSTLGR